MPPISRSFYIDIREMVEIADKLGRESGRVLRNELTTAMDKSTKHVQTAADARVNHKSRNYSRSYKRQTKVSASGIVGLVDNLARSKTGFWYAETLEFGRKAFAMKNKVLRFVIGGETIFARSVKAAPPQHILEFGLRDAEPRIDGEFAAARDRIVTKLEAL